MAASQPLTSRGLDAQVADRLRELIVVGDLPPGAHLVESSLSEEFQVSHGTVRAGLRQLEPEGLVETRPNRGVFVKDLSADDVLEVYSLRNVLEGMASRLAAERIDEEGRAELRAALQRLRDAVDAGDPAAAVRADARIHVLIVQMAGHSRLQVAHKGLFGQTALFMNATKALHQDLEEIFDMHAPLVEAICAGDGLKAESLARSHNTEDGEGLRRRMEANGDGR
jgi:DNA-binding GntR family transcriptional regulator